MKNKFIVCNDCGIKKRSSLPVMGVAIKCKHPASGMNNAYCDPCSIKLSCCHRCGKAVKKKRAK